MPSNNAYHDPALGQIMTNIAGMFAPMGAGDTASYAAARDSSAAAELKKQKLSEIAQAFQYASSPNFNKDVADRQNFVLQNYTPSQSYYAVDQGNATDLAKNQLDNATKLALPRFSPLDQGQVIPAAPSNLAAQFGLPGDLPAVAGAPKPLSETEARGALIANGPKLTDEQTVALTMAPAKTANVIDPESQQPVVAYEPDAVGKQPAYAPSAAGLTVTTDANGNTTVTSGKSLTEGQGKDAYYLNNGMSALPTLEKYGSALTNLPTAAVGGAEIMGVNVGNYAKSPEYQQAEQAGRVFLNAILRKESGAAITPQEDASYGATYLPRPGDKPEVIEQKKLARERAMQGIQLGLPASVILQMEKAGIIPPKGATVDGQTPPNAPPPETPGADQQFTEGQTATNPATGEQVMFHNGQWEPVT